MPAAPAVSTVADNSDCDDTTAQVRPGAAEFCNNRDDDCDGDLDEDAADATLFYIDGDGDGRGTTSETLLNLSGLKWGANGARGLLVFRRRLRRQ